MTNQATKTDAQLINEMTDQELKRTHTAQLVKATVAKRLIHARGSAATPDRLLKLVMLEMKERGFGPWWIDPAVVG